MKIIRTIINWFYRKKEVRLSEKQMDELMSEVRNADFMDYDGMGNYGRFPPQNKYLTIINNSHKV